ncbi:MAG: hypothetical protein HYW02_05635 [Deltaproteobacteria bacterium]|nr:hypothetical protein [Deltaproteobacteria bacterium]
MIKISLLFFLGLLLVVGCATGPRRPRGSRLPPVVSASPRSPEREASNVYIETGKNFLEDGHYSRAIDSFQEAINVDPSNGVGFYYMVWIKYKMGEYDQVENYLSRAEDLLGGDKAWKDRLEELRSEISPPSL